MGPCDVLGDLSSDIDFPLEVLDIEDLISSAPDRTDRTMLWAVKDLQ
jgi:hypothetical protein